MTLTVKVGSYYKDGIGNVHGPMRDNNSYYYKFTAQNTRLAYTDFGQYELQGYQRHNLVSQCNADGTPIMEKKTMVRVCAVKDIDCHDSKCAGGICEFDFANSEKLKTATPIKAEHPHINPERYKQLEELASAVEDYHTGVSVNGYGQSYEAVIAALDALRLTAPAPKMRKVYHIDPWETLTMTKYLATNPHDYCLKVPVSEYGYEIVTKALWDAIREFTATT